MTSKIEQGYPLIVMQNAPYSGSLARSSLDLALSFAVFAQAPRLLFCGDGVLCLKTNQNAEALGKKSLRKIIDSLPLYDLEQVFVDQASLERYGLLPEDLPGFALCLSNDETRQLIREAGHVLSL